MKLIGKLKKQVDAAADVSEKRSLIEKAGMKLTDDELEMVSGGGLSWIVTEEEAMEEENKLRWGVRN